VCTAILSLEPGQPALLAGFRDEFTDRPWVLPGRHWPRYPDLLGGQDLLAGGTWLAVAVRPDGPRAACVLNARGTLAPAASRRSRGVLPLRAAAGEPLDEAELASVDPFHLLTVQPGGAVLASWDGHALAERPLGPGLHLVVNDGLAADAADWATRPVDPGQPDGRAQELARIDYFVGRFAAAARPRPGPGGPGSSTADAWGRWFGLANGDSLDPFDPRALIVRRQLDDGRTWGTTSVSLVGLSAAGVRYDFNGTPGDPAGWYQVR
jgi:hypothetical protein